MSTIALQPELRALPTFDVLPEDCTAFLVTDDYSTPHIKSGEYVVVDTSDTVPRAGELYVIQWDSGRRIVCQANISAKFSTKNEIAWSVGSLRRVDTLKWIEAQRKLGKLLMYPGWSDGWYDTNHLQSKLVGAVIGIYTPDFEEPKRVIAGEQA